LLIAKGLSAGFKPGEIALITIVILIPLAGLAETLLKSGSKAEEWTFNIGMALMIGAVSVLAAQCGRDWERFGATRASQS
jgi:hypothetical protein